MMHDTPEPSNTDYAQLHGLGKKWEIVLRLRDERRSLEREIAQLKVERSELKREIARLEREAEQIEGSALLILERATELETAQRELRAIASEEPTVPLQMKPKKSTVSKLKHRISQLEAARERLGVRALLATGATTLAHEAERAGVSIDEMKRRLYGEA